MGNPHIAQQKTDSTLSIMINEIQEIRKSQEYLGSKYEEIKDVLKTMQNINKNLFLSASPIASSRVLGRV